MKAQAAIDKVTDFLPDHVKNTVFVRFWALTNVPLLNWVKPKVLELTAENVSIEIPFIRRNKNHLGSMYFGVLACGADAAGGLIAVKAIEESGKKISLVFKDFQAEFLKRPEADTVFTCDDGQIIKKMIEKTVETGERVNETVNVFATCPSISDELVATFRLTLSLKYSPKK